MHMYTECMEKNKGSAHHVRLECWFALQISSTIDEDVHLTKLPPEGFTSPHRSRPNVYKIKWLLLGSGSHLDLCLVLG